MASNPFRGKPNPEIQKNIEEWGKVKFKPTKFGSGNKKNINNHQGGKDNRPFKRKFDNHKRNFNKDKDSCKFNQVAKDAKPENATPWKKFKDEIVFKQREEEQSSLQPNMGSEESKKALKQREINYRKLLIEQKKQEPTQWESFADEDDKDVSKTKNKKKKKRDQAIISQELLNNFDSKKLSYKQNDQFRQIITKSAAAKYGTSLRMTIEHMKYEKAKKLKSREKKI